MSRPGLWISRRCLSEQDELGWKPEHDDRRDLVTEEGLWVVACMTSIARLNC